MTDYYYESAKKKLQNPYGKLDIDEYRALMQAINGYVGSREMYELVDLLRTSRYQGYSHFEYIKYPERPFDRDEYDIAARHL